MAKSWNLQPYARIRQKGATPDYSEIRVINPSRGLNMLIADILAHDKEATPGTKNIEYVEGGAARKRMGYTATSSGLSNPPKGLASYISESGSYIITSDAGILKKYQGGTWSALSGSVSLDATANITMTSIYQKTYAWDGTNSGLVWDGASVTRPGTMPRAKFSVIYKGYHVASGVPGQPFRLYFSPIAEPSRFTRAQADADPNTIDLNTATEVPGATSFTGDNQPQAIDINKNDGQKVMGIGFFQDLLIIFKESSIYQLYFNASGSFVVERISNSYGAACHGAIVSVENDCYFLTDKGVYVLGNEPNYYAAIRTNELSSRIKPLLQRINPTYFEKCRAYYWDDRYFLSVPLDSSSVCNTMIVYDRRFYAWSIWTNINAESMLSFKDSDGKNHFYFTEYGASDVSEFTPGSYNDKGQPIEAVFITRAFEGKLLDREKYWYTIRPIFRMTTGVVQLGFISENGSVGRTAALSPTITGGLGVDMIGDAMFGASQADTYTDADLGLQGAGSSASGAASSETDQTHTVFDIGVGIDARTLKVKFSNDGLNETFTLLGWVLVYETKGLDRFDGAYTIR